MTTFPDSREREQPLALLEQSRAFRPPASDSTCERGSGQGRVGGRAGTFYPAPRRPTRCRSRARGAQRTNYAAPSGAHRKLRGTECPQPRVNLASSHNHLGEHGEKKKETVPGSRPVGVQNSSSMPPWDRVGPPACEASASVVVTLVEGST